MTRLRLFWCRRFGHKRRGGYHLSYADDRLDRFSCGRCGVEITACDSNNEAKRLLSDWLEWEPSGDPAQETRAFLGLEDTI